MKKKIEDYSDEELSDRKYNVICYYNKKLKEIFNFLKIEKNITFYTARHTFATTAIRNGVNINIIKQSLGHKSIKTTENYIEDFSDNEVDMIISNMF